MVEGRGEGRIMEKVGVIEERVEKGRILRVRIIEE